MSADNFSEKPDINEFVSPLSDHMLSFSKQNDNLSDALVASI